MQWQNYLAGIQVTHRQIKELETSEVYWIYKTCCALSQWHRINQTVYKALITLSAQFDEPMQTDFCLSCIDKTEIDGT